jgi:PAS domain S-box-containing protein
LYTKADLALARELANRAAMAIDNAQLYANVRASEARYRSLVSATTSVVWTVNPSGQFSEGQPSWQAYTGQSWEEHRWFGWFAAVHPHDRRRIGREWLRSVRNERTFEVEGRLWHAPTGGYRYCWARAIPVRDTEGAISEWIGTVTDMHERKQAEEERKTLLAREQQARSAAQLLNRVGQALSAELDPQSLARSVIDLATKLVNAEIGALFHRVVNEDGESQLLYTLSGASSEESENVPMPGDAALFGPIFRGEAVVRSADISNDSSYGSSVPFHGMPGGHLRVRSYLAVPVISGSGEVLGGLVFGHSQPGVFGDQAEEFAVGIAAQAAIALDNARLFKQSQEAQIALRRSNDELRRANEDLNQFAYSASHDLQEPLRMVSTFSQLLQRRYGDKLDEQARQYIGYSVQGAQHMEALLRDLLAYTHAANLKGEEAVSVDANAALQKALSSLQGPIERTSAEISFDPLPVLNIAEIHLVQLFQNLIGNALKYAGDRSPHIEIAASAGRGEWLFSIRDNGIGIDPRYKDQIFGLFKRLHSNSKYPGTGIGLAICQKIVERYGGKIRVESKLGAGATFYFTIPR